MFKKENYLFALLAITFSFNANLYAQDESADDVEEVIVTGSKIKGADLYSFAPITEITSEDIAITGKASIGEILLELPGQGSGLSRTYNNGGSGAVRLDLRNLGSSRNLVLVDGRRWVNSGQGANSSVDLNSIPSALIERVEILRDGASSVYGSDAITGVVNLITKDTFDGVEMSYSTGEYMDGGGTAESMNLTMGGSGDSSSFIAGLSYVDLGALGNGERAQTNNAPSFGGSSGTPQGRFAYGDIGGGTAGCSNWQPQEGTLGATPADFRCWTSPDDRFNYNPYNYIETPNERWNAFMKGTVDLGNDMSLSMNITYQNRVSSQLLAPMPLFYGFGDFGGNEGIGKDQPFNPFGIEFCDLGSKTNDGRTCDDATLGAGNYASGWLGRRMLETGNRLYSQDIETYRFGLELEGKMTIMDQEMNYVAFYSSAQNKSLETTNGLLDSSAIKRSLSSNCGTAPDKNGTECLNIFGGQGADSKKLPNNLWSGSGSITPAMADAISFQAKGTGGNDIVNYGMDFSGMMGNAAIAFGFEHREETGFNFPDAFISKGLSTGNASKPVSGGFEIDEMFAEMVLPVGDMIEVNASTRYSDYSTFGDTTNSKVGILLMPTSDIKVRASFSEGFRAPGISALYGGAGDSYPDLNDPCDVSTSIFTGTGTTQAGVCATEGVPDGFVQPNSQIRITVGGNPNVQPETSESTNIGVVWAPSNMEGLVVTADMYDIEVENLISSIGGQLILNGCYLGTDPSYCQLIDRLPAGNISDLRNTTNNVGNVSTSGLEASAVYDFSTNVGEFSAAMDARWIDSLDSVLANGDKVNSANYVLGSSRSNNVDFKTNLSLQWSMDNMFGSVTYQYFGEGKGVANQGPTTSAAGVAQPLEDVTKIDAIGYLDLQFGMMLDDYNAIVRVGIDNILDEDPTLFTDTFANDFDPTYRTWGSQSWYANVTVKF
jgi:outer membrane receptor protein involved in Fe transport